MPDGNAVRLPDVDHRLRFDPGDLSGAGRLDGDGLPPRGRRRGRLNCDDVRLDTVHPPKSVKAPYSAGSRPPFNVRQISIVQSWWKVWNPPGETRVQSWIGMRHL